jgi:Double zinc ribbon
MTQREVPCPRCRQENSPRNRFCGSCGAPLMSGEQLATREELRPVPAGRAWPAMLGFVSKALEVGVSRATLYRYLDPTGKKRQVADTSGRKR